MSWVAAASRDFCPDNGLVVHRRGLCCTKRTSSRGEQCDGNPAETTTRGGSVIRRPVRDGTQIQRDGKPAWQPMISFASKDVRDRFSIAVIEALRASHLRCSHECP